MSPVLRSLRSTARVWLPGDPAFEQAALGRQFNRPAAQPAAERRRRGGQRRRRRDRRELGPEQGWQVAIRSGGHAWAGWAVRDGALLIDTHRMQEMELDREAMVLTARPGIKGGETLNPFLGEHGLLFFGGHCPTVCIGGYLLQGGQGWDCRGQGWLQPSTSSGSTSSPQTVGSCTATRTRTPTCTGPPAARVRGSSVS